MTIIIAAAGDKYKLATNFCDYILKLTRCKL